MSGILTPDWEPYIPVRAPAGAPNVLLVLYDDTGLAAWSPFGGKINMPTLQKLADNGLMYSQWHTTALCSPTRSTLLTGRNHHLNGMSAITEATTGFPGGHRSHPGRSAPRSARSFRMAAGARSGWASTISSPRQDVASGASRKQWPLQKGFDRYLRLPGRRDEPVVSRPGRRQPPHRPAVHARKKATTFRRTWPTRP